MTTGIMKDITYLGPGSKVRVGLVLRSAERLFATKCFLCECLFVVLVVRLSMFVCLSVPFVWCASALSCSSRSAPCLHSTFSPLSPMTS